MDTINRLKQNVEIILPEEGLEQKLKQAADEKRKLIIKLGFDPTAPDLHLGHAVVLKKLKQFQDLGHKIVVLVGSFTARIGDPTGKNKSRKSLSIDEVKHNAETYIKQLSKIIDMDKAQVVFNSDWLDTLSFSEVIQLLSKITVAQLMHRNDFNKRFTENAPIAMHELVYPILQGFDSVQIKADIEMGGTDQLFNCTMGRQLQESFNLNPQIVMCMPLLKGLDGKEKMSKSLNNIIGLTDEPNDMYGKTMSIPDLLISDFLDLATDFSPEEIQGFKNKLYDGENPMSIKKAIAKNIVTQYHSAASAAKAQTYFENQFQNKDFEEKNFIPVAVSSLGLNSDEVDLVELCSKLLEKQSKSAIRRLIENGAVRVNDEKIMDAKTLVKLNGMLKLKIGKRNFFEITG